MKTEAIIIYVMCLLFVLMGFFLALGFKDAQECVGNPLVYGARKAVNQNTGSINCYCTFGSSEYAPFYFNNDSIGLIESYT